MNWLPAEFLKRSQHVSNFWMKLLICVFFSLRKDFYCRFLFLLFSLENLKKKDLELFISCYCPCPPFNSLMLCCEIEHQSGFWLKFIKTNHAVLAFIHHSKLIFFLVLFDLVKSLLRASNTKASRVWWCIEHLI